MHVQFWTCNYFPHEKEHNDKQEHDEMLKLEHFVSYLAL